MNISNCIQSTLLAILLSLSIPYVHADSTALLPKLGSLHLASLKASTLDQLERVLTGALSVLNKIDLILEDLAQVVNNDTIKTPSKRMLKENIRDLRQLVDTIRTQATMSVDSLSIHVLMRFNDAMILHLSQALKKGFAHLPPFKIESLKLRTTKLITIEQLEEDLLSNGKNIMQLDADSQSVGLYWYNKFYRGIDTLFQKSNQYYVLPAVALGTITGVAALYVLYRYNVCEKIPLIGPAPTYDNCGNLDKQIKLKAIGYIDNFFHENQLGKMPIWSAAIAPITYAAWGATLKKVGEKGINNALRLSNWLKGGAYLNKKTEDVERVLPRITFDDLVGLENVKETFSVTLKYLEDPERFDRAKLNPEKGYLFTGATRTGKSYSAEAFFGEIRKMLKKYNRDENEISFYVINSSLIVKRGIQWILMLAKKSAPCVLFIDEIDLLGLQRAGGNKELLSEFLSEMSGCMETDPKKQVIILAATNKPENIDIALRQRGRFGKIVHFEYPTFKDRKQYLVTKLNSLAINIAQFDLDKLAYESEGCSYEDLNSMLKGALAKAKIRGEVLTQKHLEFALDEEIRNIIFKYDKDLSKDELAIIAAHQAGHTLAYMLLDTHYKLAKTTIMPITIKLQEQNIWMPVDEKEKKHGQKPIEYGHTFTYHEFDTLKFETRADKLNQLKVHLAGHVAEEIILASCGYTYHNEDKQNAFDIAKSLIFAGIKVDQLPKKAKNRLLDEAYELMNKAEQEIRQMLLNNTDKLTAISNALLQDKTLTATELYTIANIPQPVKRSPDGKVTSEDVKKDLGIEEHLPEKM